MPEDLFQFEDFELDRRSYELRRAGKVIPLQRIPLDLLCLLIERRGQIVTREEILERVWGKGVFVDSETSINTAIRKLRRALADDWESPRFVVTVPARGYRFIADIHTPQTSTSEPSRSRQPATMVGRARELASLLNGLDDAIAGRGRLFLIAGEAGVGKTRLTNEVGAIAESKRIELLVGHCAEHDEAVAYLPFVEILENFVDRVASPERLRIVLGEQGPELARLLPKLKNLLPELAPPLDLPPAQARRHLFNSFFDFVAGSASEQPILMVLEDLHWADDSTLSLLDHLTKRLSALPLMVICTYRDAGLNVTGVLAKTLEDLLRGRTANRVTLNDLPRDQVAAMLNNLSGKTPPAGVVAEIFSETGGNPFFIEELFRHLDEEQRLYDSSGQFRTQLGISEVDAPPSVRLVVARRLERLSEPTQKMLARAAVLGRIFSFEILRTSSEGDADSLLECIEEAEKAALVVSVAEGSRVRFAFSHELIRQAVIGGLSAARRQRLHLEIAEAIERAHSAESLLLRRANLERVSQLAHHYARGGNPAKAVQFLTRSVRQFADLGSNAEALAQFQIGLELLRDLPDDDRRADLELDLRLAVRAPFSDRKGFASLEVEQATERLMVLSSRPGMSSERRWWARYFWFWVHQLRPNPRKACEIASELVTQAEELGKPGLCAEAATSVAWARMYMGDFGLAAEDFDRGWSILQSLEKPAADEKLERDRQITQTILRQLGTAQNGRAISGWNLWFLGYPDQARERMSISTEIAKSGTKSMLADIHGFASYLHELLHEPDLMRARAEARLAISIDSGYASGRALSGVYLGWADALAGDLEGGIARIRQHMAELKAAGSELVNDRGFAFIAIALGRMKRYDAALGTVDESLDFIERSGQRYYAAEVHRLKGELMLAKAASNATPAEQCFITAIHISRTQHAKSWELRAATSLARLYAKQRKRPRARTILGEIYGWFTEGHDTADLKEAKTLLDELSS